MKNSFFLKTGVLTIAFMISQFAFAGQAGTVTFKTGDVSITRADKTVKQAAKNDALNAGDTIETKDGRLQLALIDGGKVSLQPNTIYKINKYEFSGKEDGTEYGFTELIKGGLRTISGLIGHKNRDRYQLKTAVATIGIRGTEYTVNFNDNNLLMTTNNGSVDVCNETGCLNAMTGQSIEVVGVGAKPKPSVKKAAAAVAPPGSSKSVFTANDALTEDGLPTSITEKALANLNGDNILVASLMKTVCGCGIDEVFKADVTTDGSSRLTNVSTSSPYKAINLTSFSSYNSDGVVAWGRAVGGDVSTYPFSTPTAITWQDYIIGRSPPPGQLNNLTGSYNVFASTAPILLNAAGVSTTVGAQNAVTGTFNFNFSTTQFSYLLNVQTVGEDYTLQNSAILTGLDKNNPTFSAGGTITSAGATCSTGGCSQALQSGANLIQGGFFGLRGERVGLQYGFNVPGGAIYGSSVAK